MENGDIFVDPEVREVCPCRRPFRGLEEINDGDTQEEDEVLLWEVIYTCAVLFVMFAALLSDRVGADSVMLAALTALMMAKIISIEEGLEGFANDGLITVLTLFVVAEGISKTGALDWYMAKILGRPHSAASAQLRLMVPIAFVSAFLNNTPVVVVMIPIVTRWAQNNGISPQQLLIPLSFASILGGTCTLIGTSTNLVVVGLLQKRYPDDESMEIGLFDLGKYGVPIALAGICYIILASPFLLPGGISHKEGGTMPLESKEDVLLGARLAPWSPAVGRSVKRSGLRDTGGIYLVSVHRSATGNVHRAVGQEFVLNVGDILYFTGLIESFGEFCEEHGLEVLTNELELEQQEDKSPTKQEMEVNPLPQGDLKTEEANAIVNLEETHLSNPWMNQGLSTVVEGKADEGIPCEVGVTKESLMRADDAERSRSISRLADLIRGTARDERLNLGEDTIGFGRTRDPSEGLRDKDPAKVVVASEKDLIAVGINARDRPGLLLDVSKALLRLNLTLRHTEASVVGHRSLSIWRCEVMDSELPDFEEIWSVLNALLENDHGILAAKQRGLRVIRAIVTRTSSLVGRTAHEVDFRKAYKAGIVAVQQAGRNILLSTVSTVQFGPGDVLVLQANDDSPLLRRPPKDFYKRLADQTKEMGKDSRSNSVSSFVNMITRSRSAASFDKLVKKQEDDVALPEDGDAPKSDDSADRGFVIEGTELSDDDVEQQELDAVKITGMESVGDVVDDEVAWKDLQVYFANVESDEEGPTSAREFLTAMEVAPHSKLKNKTVGDAGIDKLPGVFLVSIDRPSSRSANQKNKSKATAPATPSEARSSVGGSDIASLPTVDPIFVTIPPDIPLMEGDVLWFAGPASALGDLRKIPGLISFEKSEVEAIEEKIFDRRLVEAVVSRRGPLVGKTVKEVRFRTKYGAAGKSCAHAPAMISEISKIAVGALAFELVISVHREGKRVHDHPGKIKLQAGDVLLLEAGPTFIRKNVHNDRSFALLAEVEDSAPPRLRLLIPALVLTAAMLIVYTAGVASLLVCALVASMLMVATGILSEHEAREAINWEVFVTIAAAFGIGTALVNSGVAGGIAEFLVNVGDALGIGDAGLLGAVYFATFLISNIVTNNAAAALIFPVALDAAEQTGIDRVIMSYCVMLGASASFMSPFGYTTNLLIYGPGGYRTKDFIVIGTPMQVVLWILSVFFLSTAETPWWIYWCATFVALVIVATFRVFRKGAS